MKINKKICRKVKKAIKDATLVYKECALTDIRFKHKRNTEWRRKAFAYIVRQEGVNLKMIEEDSWASFQETIKRYKHEQINSPVLERKGL